MSRWIGSRLSISALAVMPMVVLLVSTVGEAAETSTVSAMLAMPICKLISTVRSRPTCTLPCWTVLNPESFAITVYVPEGSNDRR